MSLDELCSDLEANQTELEKVQMFSADDVKKYLASTVWPFLENVVAEIEDLDASLSDLVEKTEDILQPETAGIFAVVIQGCVQVMDELAKRLRPGNAGDQKWKVKLGELRKICNTAAETLQEITVMPDEADDNTDNTEPGDDDGDDQQPSHRADADHPAQEQDAQAPQGSAG